MADRTALVRDVLGHPVCLCDHLLSAHRPDLKRARCEQVVAIVPLPDDGARTQACDCPEFSHAADLYRETRWVTVYRNEVA